MASADAAGAICGLVLAGGKSRRFGREKALATLGGASFLERSVTVLRRECRHIAIGTGPAQARAEGAAEFARRFDLIELADPPGAPEGPLAGILAGLYWARDAGADRLAAVACDTPLLPADLVARLVGALKPGDIATVAATARGLEPLAALWRVEAAVPVAAALVEGRHPAIQALLESLGARPVRFESAEAFANLNTPEEYAAALASTAEIVPLP